MTGGPGGKSVKPPAAGDPVSWSAAIRAIAEQQDRESFRALFDHFAPRVKNFLLRSGVSETIAEDLAQEALLSVWRKAQLFDPARSAASTWIFTIARNLRIDFHRRDRVGAHASNIDDVEGEFLVDPSPAADQTVATGQSDAQVRTALANLSIEQRQVLELAFYEEKAHSEIARTLDIPLGTVKSRIRLAAEKLRRQMGEKA